MYPLWGEGLWKAVIKRIPPCEALITTVGGILHDFCGRKEGTATATMRSERDVYVVGDSIKQASQVV